MQANIGARAMEKPDLTKLKIGDVIAGDSKPTTRALLHQLAIEQQSELVEVDCHDDWMACRIKAGSEEAAKRALNRVGFEAWYPTYRLIKPTPRNKIASNMRHKKRHHVTITHRPLYAGWMLIRRLFGNQDIFRLYDLEGCCGIACQIEPIDGTGDVAVPIKIFDYQVEYLRAEEALGKNDQIQSISALSVATGVVKEDPRYMQQWTSKGRVIGGLDDSVRKSLFIERGDRVLRIISSRADAQAVGK